jgi:hypothetical protein
MQLLIDKGWKNYYYNCSGCKGSPTQYWTSDKYKNYEIRIKTRRSTFTLYMNNLPIWGPDWLYKIGDTLKNYGIDA